MLRKSLPTCTSDPRVLVVTTVFNVHAGETTLHQIVLRASTVDLIHVGGTTPWSKVGISPSCHVQAEMANRTLFDFSFYLKKQRRWVVHDHNNNWNICTALNVRRDNSKRAHTHIHSLTQAPAHTSNIHKSQKPSLKDSIRNFHSTVQVLSKRSTVSKRKKEKEKEKKRKKRCVANIKVKSVNYQPCRLLQYEAQLKLQDCSRQQTQNSNHLIKDTSKYLHFTLLQLTENVSFT